MIPALIICGASFALFVIIIVEAYRCGQAEARAQLMDDIGRGIQKDDDDDIDELMHNLADEGGDILQMEREREHWS